MSRFKQAIRDRRGVSFPLIIAVTLFKDLTSTDAAVAAAIVIIPLIFSAIALKTHSVDSSVLGKRRQEIVDSALKADE